MPPGLHSRTPASKSGSPLEPPRDMQSQNQRLLLPALQTNAPRRLVDARENETVPGALPRQPVASATCVAGPRSHYLMSTQASQRIGCQEAVVPVQRRGLQERKKVLYGHLAGWSKELTQLYAKGRRGQWCSAVRCGRSRSSGTRRNAGSGTRCSRLPGLKAAQVDTVAACAEMDMGPAAALEGWPPWTEWVLWRRPWARLSMQADDNRKRCG